MNNERGVSCGAVPVEDIERQTINLCEGRVYLNVDINSVGVKALIDTGSSVNLIGQKLVEKLRLSKLVTEGTSNYLESLEHHCTLWEFYTM